MHFLPEIYFASLTIFVASVYAWLWYAEILLLFSVLWTMVKTGELDVEVRAAIGTLHAEGYFSRQIALKVNVAQSTVVKTIKRKLETGSNVTRARIGRPKATREDHFLQVQSKRKRTRTAPDLREELNSSRVRPISVSTVQRRLRERGLKGCVAAKKLLLRAQNKIKRLKWAGKHKSWSFRKWSRVLFSDESKFEIFGNKRRQYVRRLVGEPMTAQCIAPTVKHGGGSVMVWGCFVGGKVGDLYQVKGILNKEGYHSILQRHAIPSGKRLVGKKFVFQQDNDPKHTSNLCKQYLTKKVQGKEDGVACTIAWLVKNDFKKIETPDSGKVASSTPY